MEGKYKTFGDIGFLMSFGRYFGSKNRQKNDTEKPKAEKKTNLKLLLIPWLAIWALLPINPVIGGIAGIGIATCMHFANIKWELTVYDYLSYVCVSVFSIFALLGLDMRIIIPLSFLCFGVMWTASCFTRIPLTAHYSKNNYNGNEAFKHPLFIKTNLILTLCWGILYLITPVWTYFIMKGNMPHWISLINMICPIFLMAFTNWFKKWYPAKIRGSYRGGR